MSLIRHLFGSPALSAPVGKGGTNHAADVSLVRSLLNSHRRATNGSALSPDGDEVLSSYIADFQKQYLNVKNPDGRVDPGGRTLEALLQSLRAGYTVRAGAAPTAGLLTWEAEGTEGGRHHSRRLHVPDGNSGLTLGRGYDLRHRQRPRVQGDLASAGMPGDMAFKISAAAGKWGVAASRFVIDSDLLDYEITPQVQLTLFGKIYDFMLNEIVRISDGTDTIKKHGKVYWDKLDQRIVDVLIDLRYRGDYTVASRELLQKHVANNDFTRFKAEIVKRSNWPSVPQDRFERRKAYVETARQPG